VGVGAQHWGEHESNSERTLVGLAEIDGSGGWVVVREDRVGAPGRVLGSVYRANEAHDDLVIVELNEPVRTGL
jgi:hypothetical protein